MKTGNFDDIESAVQFIKAQRKSKRMSLLEIAEKMNTSSSALSRMESSYHKEERPKSRPTYETLKRYASSIGYNISIKIELK